MVNHMKSHQIEDHRSLLKTWSVVGRWLRRALESHAAVIDFDFHSKTYLLQSAADKCVHRVHSSWLINQIVVFFLSKLCTYSNQIQQQKSELKNRNKRTTRMQTGLVFIC